MSLSWSHLAGDTDRFGFEIFLGADPSPTEIIEETRSWGGFRLWVGGRNLCAHSEDGARLDAVHWYVLPLLEWLAENWDALLHEERFPHETRSETGALALPTPADAPGVLSDEDADQWIADWQTWWRRHSIQACRRGGLFPNVVLRRWRDQVETSWNVTRLPGMPDHVRFENVEGAVRLPPEAVAQPLYEVLRETVNEITRRVPGSDRIADLQRAVAAIPDATRKRVRTAWLAGLAPGRWERLRELASGHGASTEALAATFDPSAASAILVHGTCQAALLFGSASPAINDDDARALATRLIRAYSGPRERTALDDVSRSVPLGSRSLEPWHEGYELAEEAREALAGVGAGTTGVEGTLQRLGLDVEIISLSDVGIRAVSLVSGLHRPTMLINDNNPYNQGSAGRRFSLAHELCHLLFDQDAGCSLAVASGPWAPRDLEKRANAFAAMYLMPREEIEEYVRGLQVPLVSLQAVIELSHRFESGLTTTLEHLTNLGFLDAAQREAIRAELDIRISAA